MSADPRVTVVMPAYNREAYIGAAIESVVAQTFRDFELLVIDDGSSDRSAEIARSFGDPRIRVETNPTNLGVARTRNRAVDLARGALLANLDSDDLAHPTRIAKQVAFLDRHPDFAMIGSFALRMTHKGRIKGVYRRPTTWDRIRAEMLFRNAFKNTTLMLRRDIAKQYPYAEDLVVCEDVDLHVRVALDHPVANLPEPLCSYRRHRASLSRVERAETRRGEERIASGILERLGVEWEPAELELHQRLRSRKRMHFDAAELVRVGQWLGRLATAGERTAGWPAQCFRETLATRWWQACRSAEVARGRGLRTWAASPLSRSLPRAAAQDAWNHLRGRSG